MWEWPSPHNVIKMEACHYKQHIQFKDFPRSKEQTLFIFPHSIFNIINISWLSQDSFYFGSCFIFFLLASYETTIKKQFHFRWFNKKKIGFFVCVVTWEVQSPKVRDGNKWPSKVLCLNLKDYSKFQLSYKFIGTENLVFDRTLLRVILIRVIMI